MYWENSLGVVILAFLVIVNGHQEPFKQSTKTRIRRHGILEDLLAVETRKIEDLTVDAATYLGHTRQQSLNQNAGHSNEKYSSRIKNKGAQITEPQYGFRTTSRKPLKPDVENLVDENRSKSKETLDFRIETGESEQVAQSDGHRNFTKGRRKQLVKFIIKPVDEIKRLELEKNLTRDMKVAEAGNVKTKKETPKKENDEEKTLSQQVADGKYGLIQKELFSEGSKRPGIISYLPNPEVPGDTKENFGGLDKDEIWLAEDHVLVLKGGIYPEHSQNNTDASWPPIDDYEAPPRQVKIPKKPKIPPPFPVQLSDDGPLEFIRGANGSGPPPFPFFPSPPSDGIPPSENGQPFPGQGFPYSPFNGSFPYSPPNAYRPSPSLNQSKPLPQLPPFLSNLPPGAAFLPPPGNLTDFDEDDPSIYYPPPYDFYYPKDNTTAVPPGPLVPGIILPPPPNFFSPLSNETENNYESDEENETNYRDDETSKETPFHGPIYLPVPRKPTIKYRPYSKRPTKRPYSTASPILNDISNQIHGSTRPDSTTSKGHIQYVYPVPTRSSLLSDNTLQTKTITQSVQQDKGPFTSPIYVPSSGSTSIYHPLPTTSPKPNHITLPKVEELKKVLPQEIYVVSKPNHQEDKTRDDQRRKNQTRVNKYENISPDIHPLRSLIRPNVTVSYIGKYGHLPLTTPPTAEKTKQEDSPVYNPPSSHKTPPLRGHYITTAPRPVYIKDEKENEVNSISPAPEIVTVTPISDITRTKARPVASVLHYQQFTTEMTPSKPSKATFYFYEEPVIDKGHLQDIPQKTSRPALDFITPKPVPLSNEISSISPVYVKTTRFPTAEVNKETPKYYSTITVTAKTPVRQFLEETFHASNVLPNKPQTSHYAVTSHFEPGFYREIHPQTKLNYVRPTVKNQMVKYQYVTEIPKENRRPVTNDGNALEIEHAGLSGLQKINLQTENPIHDVTTNPQVTYVTTPKFYKQPSTADPLVKDKTRPNENRAVKPQYAYSTTTTPKPDEGSFIPSNYYATANPQDLYLTPQDHTIIDDITKNYFTIFGQKIVQSTTPITPTHNVQNSGINQAEKQKERFPQSHKPEKTRPQDIPTHQIGRRPYKALKPSTANITTNKPKPFVHIITPTRVKSNFEQYLKEITGEDQREFVEVLPTRPKKPKANLGFPQDPNYTRNTNYNPISIYLNPPNPPRQPGLSQYLVELSSAVPPTRNNYPSKTGFGQVHNFKYVPADPYVNPFSTTVRPTSIEIEPQFIQHVSSTVRPLDIINNRPISSTMRPQDFRQFIQEISTFTSPTTLRPIRIKTPNQYLNELQFNPNQQPNNQKPISLESDTLVNYKEPRPEVNPDAEIIDVQKPQLFEQNSNFKIVDPPDLSQGPRIRQYPIRNRPNNKHLFDPNIQMNPSRAKEFFQNLPQSGYFNPVDNSYGNSFISYNLPGNGGHFYFLTPQAIERDDESSSDSQSERNNRYSIIKRSEFSENNRRRTKVRDNHEQRHPSRITEEYPQHGFSNQDYLRRRRKKT